MRLFGVGLRHTLPVLAVITLGYPLSALPRGAQTAPLPGVRPAPFQVEGTETVELRWPTIGPNGTAEVSIVNTNEDKTLVAWKIDHRKGDSQYGSARKVDGYSLLSTQPTGMAIGSGAEDWLIGPGGERRHDTEWKVHDLLADGASVRLVLDMVIFDDLSWEGDATEVALTFQDRAERLARRERWLPVIRELVRTSHSDDVAVERLTALVDGIDGDDLESASMRREARETIEHLEQYPEYLVAILEEYLEIAETETLLLRQSVPAELRETHEEGAASREGLRRAVGTSGYYECEEMTASHSSSIMPCDGWETTEWTHSETWHFVCGNGVNQGTGHFTATGACAFGKQCPPDVNPENQYSTGPTQQWKKTWQNFRAYVGPFYVRCEEHGPPGELVYDCPCEWIEEPPTWDGPEGEDAPAPGDGTCTYACGTPILVDLDRGGFQLTDLDGGVEFDIDADSARERVAWTVAGSGDGFLALDRNGNGSIDGGHELFGDETAQPPTAAPHGYLALAVFDDPAEGGDGDGLITAADAAFDSLVLWVDADHDGVSDAGELVGLAAAGVESIDLDFRENRRKDRHGNELRYRSLVRLEQATTQSVDVFFLTEEP